MKSPVAPGRSGAKRAPEPEAQDACTYKKVELPNVSQAGIDVDAVMKALENRNSAKRAAQPAEEPGNAVAVVAAAEAAQNADAAPSDRMPDADFEEIARVLKMTRSAAAAREWGLRLLVETKRAREAEERLSGKA